MTNAMLNKREIYYIKKDFQFRFIIKFAMLVILSCLLFGAIVYLFSLQSTTTVFENSRFVMKSTADYILPTLGLAALFIVSTVLIATIYMLRRLTHSIAGPLFRIESRLLDLKQGNLAGKIQLRKTDELHELAGNVNDISEQWNAKIKAIIHRLQVMEQSPEQVTAQQIADLKKELDYFKL